MSDKRPWYEEFLDDGFMSHTESDGVVTLCFTSCQAVILPVPTAGAKPITRSEYLTQVRSLPRTLADLATLLADVVAVCPKPSKPWTQDCTVCKGLGSSATKCRWCSGTGYETCELGHEHECEHCDGDDDPCEHCAGTDYSGDEAYSKPLQIRAAGVPFSATKLADLTRWAPAEDLAKATVGVCFPGEDKVRVLWIDTPAWSYMLAALTESKP